MAGRYAWRIAAMGSMRVARRAGTQQATAAVAATSNAAMAISTGSSASRPATQWRRTRCADGGGEAHGKIEARRHDADNAAAVGVRLHHAADHADKGFGQATPPLKMRGLLSSGTGLPAFRRLEEPLRGDDRPGGLSHLRALKEGDSATRASSTPMPPIPNAAEAYATVDVTSGRSKYREA